MKGRVKRAVSDLRSLAFSTTTSRETLLALSELARRHGGDHLRVADLSAHELRVFSQNGEDGVLAEIIRRSGAPSRYFVEFGAGTGAENNTAVLADAFGWSGLLLEADPASFLRLERKYAGRADVTTARELVTPENLEEIFGRFGVPPDVDLLCLDVDGSEYWVWEALESWRPRFVVVEYNSALAGDRRLVQPRDQVEAWDRSDFFGASIAALHALGERKGYRLVHTEMTGVNAFFARKDVPGEYPPPEAIVGRGPNYFLLAGGHPPDARGRSYVDLDSRQELSDRP